MVEKIVSEYFPENLGAVSKEQGEQFHQDTKEMESRKESFASFGRQTLCDRKKLYIIFKISTKSYIEVSH